MNYFFESGSPPDITAYIQLNTIIMAKRKSNSNNKPKRQVVRRRPLKLIRRQLGMTQDEMLYRKLLIDPCNAQLPPSPYGDEAGTLIQRNHWVFNNFNDAICYFWHPWLGLFRHAGVSGTPATVAPVSAFQAGQSGTGRALAGCADIMYTGAENSRAGTVQCGIVPGSLVGFLLDTANGGKGQTVDIANIAQFLPNVERTPVDRCSVNWFPAEGDAQFIPAVTFDAANYGLVQDILAKTHFVVIFTSGAGANNMRLSLTPVNEVAPMGTAAPSAGSSVPVWTITPKSSPRVDVTKVVSDFTKKDTSWYINTFRKVAMFGIGLANASYTAGLPGALGFLTQAIAGGPQAGGKTQQYVRAAK